MNIYVAVAPACIVPDQADQKDLHCYALQSSLNDTYGDGTLSTLCGVSACWHAIPAVVGCAVESVNATALCDPALDETYNADLLVESTAEQRKAAASPRQPLSPSSRQRLIRKVLCQGLAGSTTRFGISRSVYFDEGQQSAIV